MAVNQTPNHTTPHHPGQDTQQPYVSQQAPQADLGATPATTSWLGLDDDLFGTTINTTPGSEVLVNAETVFREQFDVVLDKARKTLDVDLLRIDNTQNMNLPYSVLVFVLREKGSNDPSASYMPVLIEATDEAQSVTSQDIGGLNVEIRRLTSDSYGPREREEIENEVRKFMPGVRRLIDVDAIVLPRDFDLDNKDDVLRFTATCIQACRNVLVSRKENWRDINLTRIQRQGSGLIAHVQFNKGGDQFRDEAGLPLRSDIRVALKTPEINHGPGQPITRSGQLARIAGFVDLTFTGRPQQQPMIGQYMPVPTQTYLARVVLTHVDMTRTRSTGGQLLAMLNAVGLYQNNTALLSLFPNTSLRADELDLHDIGALNIEANIQNDPEGGKRVKDLKSGNVSDAEIIAYLNALIHRNFEIAMDVSDAGADTWLNSVFVAAADNNPAAIQAIHSAADELTNGAFSQIFKAGTPIARVEARLPLGYYMDKKDRKRDIRDVDYLAVINMFGEKDFRQVEQWSDAKTNPAMNQALSLYIQRRTIESIVGEVTYTGYGTRLLINPEFLKSLAEAAHHAGLMLNIQAPNAQRAEQRYVYTGQATYSPDQMMGGLYNQSYGQQTHGQPQFGATHQGRWGTGYPGSYGR